MGRKVRIGRREFLVSSAGGGFALGFSLWSCSRVGRFFSGPEEVIDPDSWLKIAPSGGVTIVVARAEMGQGVWTALPMIVAEELEANWATIEMEPAVADRKRYGRQRTGGSMSIRTSWRRLRRVGATAREMLLTAAAQRWGVSREECCSEQGAVVHQPTGRRLDYGKLATTAATLPLPNDVVLKDPPEFDIVGRSVKRLDTHGKVDGSARFGIDIRRPGMRYAVLARCTEIGGTLKSFDDSAAREIPGLVEVARSGEAVAVVAENSWAAMAARKALRVEWNSGPNAELSSESIRAEFERFPEMPAASMYARGDPRRAVGDCAQVLEAVYEVPFLAQAPLEPMNCTVDARADRCEIWVPTQDLDDVQKAAVRITGLEYDRIVVHNTLVGGGFGRRLVVDYAEEAVRLALTLKGPVQLLWSREDDMRHGFYHPASYHRLRGGLDSEGWPVSWEHNMIAPSIMSEIDGNVDGSNDPEVRHEMACLYGFPHLAIGYSLAETPVRVGWMRSVYNMPSAFAGESFLDELITAAGKDPLEFRRRLLDAGHEMPDSWNPSRLRGALDLVAAESGWNEPPPPGVYRGISCHGIYLSYCAAVAEVSVEESEVRVRRLVVAVDCGVVVNPDIVRAQVEGGITFGLSNALYGEINLRDGAIEQSNYHDYPVLGIDEAPVVEAHIVASTAEPTGIGEIPVPAAAPAVANAIFAATGKRVRRIPLAPALAALTK